MPRLGGTSASPVTPPLSGTAQIPFRDDTYGTAQDVANLAGAPAVAVEFTSDADRTLTQAEYQAESISFTDSPTTLTAGRSVIFPAHFPTKWVKNTTAQVLTLKKSGQTGVTLGIGSTAIIASGTTDVVIGPGASSMSNPMTASGDIITGGSSGTPQRVAVGSAGQVLRVNGSSTPAWFGGVTTLTDGTTISVDASLNDNFRVTLGGNRTLANPTNLVNGQVINIRIKQDATGSRTLAYGTKYKFPGGTAPVLTTTANAYDFMSCQYDSTDDTLFCVLNKDFK